MLAKACLSTQLKPAKLLGQVEQADAVGLADHEGVLDRVLEFSHVAWPAVIHDGTSGLCIQSLNVLPGSS